MGRLVQYLAVTALGLGAAFWVATTAASAVSDSLNSSAQIIAEAGHQH